MDVIGGYLLIILILFAINISLLIGNYKINTLKLILISFIGSVIIFIMMNLSDFLNYSLLGYLSYLMFIIAIGIFTMMIYYMKSVNFKIPLFLISVMFFISIFVISSQSDLDFWKMILYSLFVFIIIFSVYQLTKLLHHAKRQYYVLIGEYMSLFSVLIFILSLTYNSTVNLDYTMFSSFLILTPTYQLIYVIIAIIVILVAGVLINDYKGGNS